MYFVETKQSGTSILFYITLTFSIISIIWAICTIFLHCYNLRHGRHSTYLETHTFTGHIDISIASRVPSRSPSPIPDSSISPSSTPIPSLHNINSSSLNLSNQNFYLNKYHMFTKLSIEKCFDYVVDSDDSLKVFRDCIDKGIVSYNVEVYCIDARNMFIDNHFCAYFDAYLLVDDTNRLDKTKTIIAKNAKSDFMNVLESIGKIHTNANQSMQKVNIIPLYYALNLLCWCYSLSNNVCTCVIYICRD